MKHETFIVDSHINTDNAYKKMKDLLASEEYVIDENHFSDIYSLGKIAEDKKYVESLEKKFQTSNTQEMNITAKRASVLEYIVYQQGEINEWFGKGALTIKTSRTDDIKNGIDLVVEFENQQGSHLGLAIDISFGKELEKKLARIKSEIDAGTLGQVEYYQSPHFGKKALTSLPRVVLAFSGKTTDDLLQLWLEEENEKLGDHPAQFQILVEILLQLKKFQQYAQGVRDNEELADIYENIIKTVKRIKDEKKKVFSNSQDHYLDEGYDRLDAALAIFEHEINKNKPEKSPEDIKEELYKKHPYLRKKAS